MRTVFIHGETERFEAARFELVTNFTVEHPDQASAELAMLLLRDKFARDGLLTHWTKADVVRFMTRTAPRKVVLESNWAAVPDFVRGWVSFLHEEGLLTGDSPEALEAAVADATPQYLAGMAEPTEWGTEKFWRVALLEHGVDETDADAVAEFAARVEEGEIDVDEDLLEGLDDSDPDEGALWLPPAQDDGVAPTAEFAAEAPIVERIGAVVKWARENGDPEQADALVELVGDTTTADLLLEWCERAGLLRLSEERIVPTLLAEPMLEEPELLWNRLWQRFLLVEDSFQDQFDEPDEDALADLMETVLSALHTAGGPVPVEELVGFTAGALEFADAEEMAPVVRMIIAQWVAMNAARIVEDDEQHVELTPAGQWAARESLRAFGYRLTTMEELRDSPAELITLIFAEAPPQVQQELCATWVSHRGAERAAAGLAELLARVDEPTVRLAALAVLESTGDEGVSAARELVEDERCGPAVRMWLQAAAGLDVAKPGDELALTLDGMAATAEGDVADFIVEFSGQPVEDQLRLIEEMAQAETSSAPLLLSALAEYHPEEKVADAAETALN